jgi:hypothetical protein
MSVIIDLITSNQNAIFEQAEYPINRPFTVLVYSDTQKTATGKTKNMNNFFNTNVFSGDQGFLYLGGGIYLIRQATYGSIIRRMRENINNTTFLAEDEEDPEFIMENVPLSTNIMNQYNNCYNVFEIVRNYTIDIFCVKNSVIYNNFASVFGDIVDYAKENANTFYIDTGLTPVSLSDFQVVYDTFANMTSYDAHKYFIFAAINTPILWNIRVSPLSSLQPSYRVITFAGYRIIRKLLLFGDTLTSNDIFISASPISASYGSYIIGAYNMEKAYYSALNKFMGYSVTLDKVYRNEDLLYAANNNIRVNTVKNVFGNLFLANNLTNYDSSNILSEEHAARMALDIARELQAFLSSIIGKKVGADLTGYIDDAQIYIKNRILKMTPNTLHKFSIRINRIENNTLYLDVVYYDYRTVKEIVLITVAV